MISSQQSSESLVERLRALADKRQKEAAREGRLIAQGLLGAAKGYRALADALERQPSLSWLQPKAPNKDGKLREPTGSGREDASDVAPRTETMPGRKA